MQIRFPVPFFLLVLQQCLSPAHAKFRNPDWNQLVTFPSKSASDAFNLKWDATNTATPARLYLWKGPPENFTLIHVIGDSKGNKDVKNTGSLTWVIKDGEVPSSGKDYTIELRLNPGVKGKESSQWSDYFEFFNEEKPDPQQVPRPSVFNIGTAAPEPTNAALPTDPAVTPPTTNSDNSDSKSPGSDSESGPSGKNTINLSPGALAGVIIGTIIGTAIISALATLFIVRRRKNKLQAKRGNGVFRGPQPMPPAAPVTAASRSATLTEGYGSDNILPDGAMHGPGMVKRGTFAESPVSMNGSPQGTKGNGGVSELYG